MLKNDEPLPLNMVQFLQRMSLSFNLFHSWFLSSKTVEMILNLEQKILMPTCHFYLQFYLFKFMAALLFHFHKLQSNHWHLLLTALPTLQNSNKCPSPLHMITACLIFKSSQNKFLITNLKLA